MPGKQTSVTPAAPAPVSVEGQAVICPFNNVPSFEGAWRMARCISASGLVPPQFRGEEGVPNAMIALELANRLGISPFQVMQNLYVIKGRPAFSAQFVIAAIQRCGRYSALKYRYRRDKDGAPIGCTAYATELSSGEQLEGPEITMQMARAEGWLGKTGSKWQTMPEIMLMYRAAAFFGRIYAPDVMMGFAVEGDTPPAPAQDLGAADIAPAAADDMPKHKQSKAAMLNALADEDDTQAETVDTEEEKQ